VKPSREGRAKGGDHDTHGTARRRRFRSALVADRLVRFVVTLRDSHDQATLVEADAKATPRCPTDDPSTYADCLRLCSG
jgi:hypothetical protein